MALPDGLFALDAGCHILVRRGFTGARPGGRREITGIIQDQAGAVPGRHRHRHQRRHQPATRRHVDGRRRLHRRRAWRRATTASMSSLPGSNRSAGRASGSPPVRRPASTSTLRLATYGSRSRSPATRRSVPRGNREPRDRVEHEQVVQLPLNGRRSSCSPRSRPASRCRRFVAAAHQRRPAADERVSLRRHLGAAARTGSGGVFPDRRRHSGIQDREQQPARRVRPFNGGVVNLTTNRAPTCCTGTCSNSSGTNP